MQCSNTKVRTLTSYDRYQVQSPQYPTDGHLLSDVYRGPAGSWRTGQKGDLQFPSQRGSRNMAVDGRGASSHDHGRHIANILLAIAEGKVSDYGITDGELRAVAQGRT